MTEIELELINKKSAKLGGIFYGEYLIPFTSEDALGILQVKNAFENGVTFTNILFSNGVVMPMQKDNFPAFCAWFAQNRNQYFI